MADRHRSEICLAYRWLGSDRKIRQNQSRYPFKGSALSANTRGTETDNAEHQGVYSPSHTGGSTIRQCLSRSEAGERSGHRFDVICGQAVPKPLKKFPSLQPTHGPVTGWEHEFYNRKRARLIISDRQTQALVKVATGGRIHHVVLRSLARK